MKRKYFLTYNDKNGTFYLNGKNVTVEWYNFFASLPSDKEYDCARIFIRRYAKKLLNPPSDN